MSSLMYKIEEKCLFYDNQKFKILLSENYNAFIIDKYNNSGIYMAIGLIASDSFKKCIYIGSSRNLRKRIHVSHCNDLKNNRHSNPPLQNYYNKYGWNNIIWILLEDCPIDILTQKEQYWLDREKPFADIGNGFNISYLANKGGLAGKFGPNNPLFERKRPTELMKTLHESNKGRKRSEEFYKNLSVRMSGKSHPLYNKGHTEETKRKMSISKIGIKHPNFGKKMSAFQKRKILESTAKTYYFLNPNNETVIITNLSLFCRNNNLDNSCMSAVSRGTYKSHKGWRKL